MSYPTEDKSVAQRFGENLLDARQRAGYSQDEVARRSSLHPTYISYMEEATRTPSLDTVVRLAGALGVEVAELVRGIEWSPPPPPPSPPWCGFVIRPAAEKKR